MVKNYSKEQVDEILETEKNYRDTISISYNVLNLGSYIIRECFSEKNRDKARQVIRGLETYPEVFSKDKYIRSKVELVLSKLEQVFL